MADPPAGSVMSSPHVRLLVDFTNSIDHDEGTDDLVTRTGLTRWLVAQELLPRRATATEADLALARDLRDALHAALVANHDLALAPANAQDVTSALTPLARLAGQLPLALSASPEGPGLRPVLPGVRGALTQILVAVQEAVADGSWRRVKICSSDECHWAYVDATKNQSRRWCEWGCGNRIKTRNYRARQRVVRTGAVRRPRGRQEVGAG